jgi:predicted dehydrogenase
MSRINRRTFLKGSLAAAGAGFIISTSSHRVLGANDRFRIGVAGLHSRGGAHMSAYSAMKDVDICWLIDVDKKVLDGAVARVAKSRGSPPKATQDVRKALDDKDLDGISMATPNHWHTLMTIWTVQAGKDVYVEKPCTHNVCEGRIATEIIRKSKQMVQTGTQRRSEAGWAKMVELTKSGQLGKLLISHGFASKTRGSIGVKDFSDPPPELDFDIWLGPAPKQRYHANLVHYNWHWFWDFGCGEIGNQGVHQTDVARWAIPGATHPTFVFSLGGRIGYKDQAQTPNTQLTVYDYGQTLLVFEVCGLVGGKNKAGESGIARVSNDFLYEAGKVVDNGKFYPAQGSKVTEMPKVDVKLGPGDGPFGNFIAACKSRRKEDLNAPYEEGHYSAALCHLGNISYRLGKDVTWGKVKKPFESDYANERFDRINEHLVKTRGLNLEDWTCRIGAALKFDPKTEKFVDAPPEANAMLTRPPRKPFDVPETA